MQPCTFSREEEAELAHNNKKVKDISHVEFNDGTQTGSPLPKNQYSVATTKTSFKDKLIGEIPGAYAGAFNLTYQMDSDVDSNDDNGETISSNLEGVEKVKLSKETK